MTAALQLTEGKLNITMKYDGKHGNKGYDGSDPDAYTHQVYVTSCKPTDELNDENIPSGSIPISVVHGRKIPSVTLDGYFPYRFPTEFFDVFLPSLATHRIVNSCKNIFLVGSILTVADNGNGVFSELPESSMWYVKKYTWKRSIDHRDRGGFNLVLLKWYKEI